MKNEIDKFCSNPDCISYTEELFNIVSYEQDKIICHYCHEQLETSADYEQDDTHYDCYHDIDESYGIINDSNEPPLY